MGRRPESAMGFILLLSLNVFAALPVAASQPGRGTTADFEVHYLKFIIDHHFAALRMTELAAGTDVVHDPLITAFEGTSPTPDSVETEAKSGLDPLKSLARRNNRMQREEILTAQGKVIFRTGMASLTSRGCVDRAGC